MITLAFLIAFVAAVQFSGLQLRRRSCCLQCCVTLAAGTMSRTYSSRFWVVHSCGCYSSPGAGQADLLPTCDRPDFRGNARTSPASSPAFAAAGAVSIRAATGRSRTGGVPEPIDAQPKIAHQSINRGMNTRGKNMMTSGKAIMNSNTHNIGIRMIITSRSASTNLIPPSELAINKQRP